MPISNNRTLLQLHPSAFLLAAQLLLLVLYSVFDGYRSEGTLLSVFGLVILILRVWVVNRSPAFDWIAWILAVPGFILAIVSAFIPNPTVNVWSSLFEAGLYFYAAASLIAYMMKDNLVTTDELFAAGATFTLLAWGFAHLFVICQILSPGSFINSIDSRSTLTFFELLFLSFTNLSTAGLSDLLPVTTSARVLLMFEQFVGVGYVTVVMSRLVGLTLARQNEKI